MRQNSGSNSDPKLPNYVLSSFMIASFSSISSFSPFSVLARLGYLQSSVLPIF